MKKYAFLPLAALILCIYSPSAFAGKIVEADDSSYHNEVVRSESPVLLEFYANWCGACRKSAPAVESIARRLDGKLKVVKMDVDKSRSTAAKYEVRSIPAFFYVVDGSVKGSAVGAYPEDELLKELGISAGQEEE